MSEMRSKGLFDHDNLEIRKTLSDRACYTGSRSHQDLTFWATPSKTSVRAVYRRDANGADCYCLLASSTQQYNTYKHDRRVRNAERSVGIKECGLDRYRQLRRSSDHNAELSKRRLADITHSLQLQECLSIQIPRVRSAGKIDRRAGCRMAGPPLKFQFRRTAASFVDLRSPTKQVASYTI